MKKLLIIIPGILVYAIWTCYSIKVIYKTFCFFKPLWALLNFDKYTYGWISFTLGFLIGYFLWLDEEPCQDSKK